MAIHTQVQVIDADAHVVETERTWDYLAPSEQQYRPLLYASPDDPISQYWVIDGKIRGLRFPSLTEHTVREMSKSANVFVTKRKLLTMLGAARPLTRFKKTDSRRWPHAE